MLFFLVKNNLKLMLRDKIAMLFLILLPIVLIAILSSAFSEKLSTGYEMKPLIVGDSVEAGENIKTNNGDLIHSKSFVKLESIKVDPLPSSTVYYGIVEIVFVIWFGMIVLSTIVNNERKYGVDRRIGITSVSSGTLFLGKLIPTVLAVSIQIGIAIIASTILMDINWGSSPMLSAAILFLEIIATSSLAIMMSLLIKNQPLLNIIIIVPSYFFGFIGGSFQTYMYNFVSDNIAELSPIYYINRSLVEISTKGYSDYTGKCLVILITISTVAILIGIATTAKGRQAL